MTLVLYDDLIQINVQMQETITVINKNKRDKIMHL